MTLASPSPTVHIPENIINSKPFSNGPSRTPVPTINLLNRPHFAQRTCSNQNLKSPTNEKTLPEATRGALDFIGFIISSLFYRLEIRRGVQAEGADEIVGELTLVDVSADLANVARLALGLGLGLYVAVVIRIGHSLGVRDDSRLGDAADEQAMSSEIEILLDLKRHKGIDISGKEGESVVGAQGSDLGELICHATALESEGLEHLEGGVYRQTANVHLAGLLDDVLLYSLFLSGRI